MKRLNAIILGVCILAFPVTCTHVHDGPTSIEQCLDDIQDCIVEALD